MGGQNKQLLPARRRAGFCYSENVSFSHDRRIMTQIIFHNRIILKNRPGWAGFLMVENVKNIIGLADSRHTA